MKNERYKHIVKYLSRDHSRSSRRVNEMYKARTCARWRNRAAESNYIQDTRLIIRNMLKYWNQRIARFLSFESECTHSQGRESNNPLTQGGNKCYFRLLLLVGAGKKKRHFRPGLTSSFSASYKGYSDNWREWDGLPACVWWVLRVLVGTSVERSIVDDKC